MLTADGKTLYLAESQTNQHSRLRRAWRPARSAGRSVSIDLPKHESGDHLDNQPDGICLDADGNLYVAHYGMKQVQVLDPERQSDPPLSGRQPDDEQRGLRRTEPRSALRHRRVGRRRRSAGGLFRLDLGVKGLKILPEKK